MNELGRRGDLDAEERAPEVLRREGTETAAREPGAHGALRRDLELQRTGAALGLFGARADLPGTITLECETRRQRTELGRLEGLAHGQALAAGLTAERGAIQRIN